MSEFSQSGTLPPADKVAIGVVDALVLYVSPELLAQKTAMRELREHFGLIKRYPVKTDLSGTIVMVEADSQKEAVDKYLSNNRKEKR